MKKILLLVILSVLSCFCLSAQRTGKTDANIFGHVVDAATGEHLPFAFVRIVEQNIGTAADSTGHYFLANLREGTLTAEVSLMGYETLTVRIRAEIGQSRNVDFSLSADRNRLDEVVVTGNRYVTRQRETGQIVGIVPPQLFEKAAAVTPAEVLSFQPGLRVEYDCSNCGFPQLVINGLPGEYSQVLLDSRPVFSSLSMVYGLEQLPASMIERVEVVRGGGSALFGSNAIAGTVNIITKEPVGSTVQLGTQAGILGGQATDINTSLNASLISEDRRTGAYLFSMVRRRDAYDRNADGFSDAPMLRSETLGARAFHKLSPDSRLTAEYHHIHEFRRGGDRLDQAPHLSEIAEQTEHYIDGGSLAWDREFGNNTLNAYAAAQFIARKSYYGAGQDPDAYGRTSDATVNGGLQYLHRFDRLWFLPATFTAGAEYNYNRMHDRILAYDRDMEQTVRVLGAYLQNEWSDRNLGLLLGLRMDKHNLVGAPVFSPRLTMRWAPDTHWTLRAGYARGFRAPQAYDEDLHVNAVGGAVSLISLAPGLRPETSDSFTLSADYWLSRGDWKFDLLAEGFHTTLRNVFALESRGLDNKGNVLLERVNASGARVRGVNLEMKLLYNETVEFQGGVTLQQSRYLEDLEWSADVAPQRRMFRSPDVYGFFTMDYHLAPRWDITVGGTFTGPMLVQHFAGTVPADTECMTPAFFDGNLRLCYHFHLTNEATVELCATCKNFLDQYQPDIDFGALKDSAYIYGPALPRSFYFGAKLIF
ncbi:MAG: TonB-dependent receptor [Bacteroidales bacterium]|jgi:outer membrane receptor for ferrienterochelin and colicins|nr:TonB-dependent receptor [Bacteroidales bacterium]